MLVQKFVVASYAYEPIMGICGKMFDNFLITLAQISNVVL